MGILIVVAQDTVVDLDVINLEDIVVKDIIDFEDIIIRETINFNFTQVVSSFTIKDITNTCFTMDFTSLEILVEVQITAVIVDISYQDS